MQRDKHSLHSTLTSQLLGQYQRQSLDMSVEWEAGIDEAGRGPVLGPMVYSMLAWPVHLREQLSQLGFNDSKQLTEADREAMWKNLKVLKESKIITYLVVELSAERLSNQMLRVEKYNLNAISHDTAIAMIQDMLDSELPLRHVYVDTVGNSTAYQYKLRDRFQNRNVDFTVTEKADGKYTVVGAASICAKVTRDQNILQKQQGYSQELGCGYPGDAKTVSWLNNHCDEVFGLPNDLVRYSWKTVDNLLDKKREQGQAVRVSFVEQGGTKHCFQDRSRPEVVAHLKMSQTFSI